MHSIPKLDAAGYRNFAIVTGLAIAVIFGLFIPWVFELSYRLWPWAVCAVLAIWGLVAPMTLEHPYQWWMKMALLISKVTTPILLGIVFFVVLTPIALIMRILGKDPIPKDFVDERSYRLDSEASGQSDMEAPF